MAIGGGPSVCPSAVCQVQSLGPKPLTALRNATIDSDVGRSLHIGIPLPGKLIDPLVLFSWHTCTRMVVWRKT
jgi:hypothetical protein